ncbi:hypothetical protein FRC07_012203 [Ceratobasidium sp. 392]|nr:hypothetical protein FRC07_012203 [Ceratobasidium sp. 392]
MHNYMLVQTLLEGQFDLQVQPEDPAVNKEIQSKAALQVRELRQRTKEPTEQESNVEPQIQTLNAEGLGSGRKKRKRSEQHGPSTQSHSVTEADKPSAEMSHAGSHDDWPPVTSPNYGMYAAPVYPKALLPGWQPIWSFEHGQFYFHHLQTGTTTWELNNDLIDDNLFEAGQEDVPGPGQDSTPDQNVNLDIQRQMMYLFSFVLAKQSQIKTQAASVFLCSNVYELCDYVKLFTKPIVNNVLQHPEAWRIPDEIISQTEQRHQFVSRFKINLTQLRSQEKTTIYCMPARGADVNETMRAIAPAGMVVTEPHCARLAWIMLASVEFDKLVEARKMKSIKFWEWIGTQLLELKKRIQTDPRLTTNAKCCTTLACVFSHALPKHCDQFPPQAPVEPPQACPGWQESVKESLSTGAAI